MKLAITARIRHLFDRYWVRIVIGGLFSLLVHGFILSLQLGIPGLGLPGLALPWSERRAQTPELSVRIANLTGSPAVEPQALLHSLENDIAPKPQKPLQQPSNNQPLTELPNARIKQAPLQSASNSVQIAKALKSNPALAQALHQYGTPPPDDQSTPALARSQPALIALTGDRPSSFMVPAPDPDDWWRTAPEVTSIPLPMHPEEETAPPAIALQTAKQSPELATEPAPALQKPNEQESFERPDDTQAKEPTPTKTPDIATELAARKQGEEIAQQEATRKQEEREAAQIAQDLEIRTREEMAKQAADTAARLLAAQELEAEQAARRTEELAAKKLEDAKKQELEDAELHAKELEARRQTDEITRQQAAALALQKQVEEAQKQAEEIVRQKADAAAATAANAQRESIRLAAAVTTSADNGVEGSTMPNGVGNQASPGGGGSLASRALASIGKIGPMDIDSSSAMTANHKEEDSRRHSVFGIVDNDIRLAMYIDGWRMKIERNGNLNYAQSSKDKAREDPIVTTVIRSDGSLQDTIINRSSGRDDIDEDVRRIAHINAPYSAFPASLAQKYDVIEIRRVWHFDERLRILEEVH